MKSFLINDKKAFMAQLFGGTCFDSFLLKELHIIGKASFDIDGSTRRDFYSKEELETMDTPLADYISYGEIRPLAFEMIRGKKTPIRIHLVLVKMTEEDPNSLLSSRHMTIRFEKGACHIISGVSYRAFSLEKPLETEKEWDDSVATFLDNLNLSYEPMV